jgi:hypothetical protein
MSESLSKLLDDCLSEDQHKWAKLSSEIQFRRIELYLLREIRAELKELNERMSNEAQRPGPNRA